MCRKKIVFFSCIDVSMTENEVINCTDKTKWLVCTDHWFNFYDLELFCIVISLSLNDIGWLLFYLQALQ